MHRANWDLRLPASNPITLSLPAFKPPWTGDTQGPPTDPGTYTVALFIGIKETLCPQGIPQKFEVKPVPTAPSRTDF